jgi:flagellar hook protein FlgE
MEVGLGVKMGSIDTIHTQGNLETTGRLLDLAIAGDGFFALTDNATQGAGQTYLTRAGNFSIDQNGYLVDPGSGYIVMGRRADASGEVRDSAPIQALKIDPKDTVPAQVTRNITLGGNLDSQTEPVAASSLDTVRSLFTNDGHSIGFQIGDTIEITGGTVGGASAAGTSVITITAETSLADILTALSSAINSVGGADAEAALDASGHIQLAAGSADITDLAIGIAAGADPSREAQVTSALAQLFDDGNGAAGMTALSGGAKAIATCWFRQADATTSVDVFDSQGNPRTVSVSFARDTSATQPNNTFHYQVVVPHLDGNSADGSFATGTMGTLTFNPDGTLDDASAGAILPVVFDPDGTAPANGGVDPLSISIDMTGVTQFFAPNTVAVEAQDGHSQGELDSVVIDNNGVLRGVYTNGAIRDLAQIMLATVANQDGMTRSGSNMFSVNSASGGAVFGKANLGGRGAIESGALELSNVDLAAEFTDLIITQRGFQANARVITASDELMQSTVNIV